jgi:cathepsin F
LEGANYLATGELVSLSEQQLVDCDHECDPEEGADACDAGCNGGLMNNALEYALKVGGLQTEKDYPYTGVDGTCKFNKNKVAVSVSNFSVVSIDEDQIAANLVKNGPLTVGINAAWMQTYVGGVSCPYLCSKRNIDHAILLVGYSTGYAPIRLKEKPYWILKNSWGESWGEDGYYKICRGRNVCGVESMVSTVTVASTPIA